MWNTGLGGRFERCKPEKYDVTGMFFRILVSLVLVISYFRFFSKVLCRMSVYSMTFELWMTSFESIPRLDFCECIASLAKNSLPDVSFWNCSNHVETSMFIWCRNGCLVGTIGRNCIFVVALFTNKRLARSIVAHVFIVYHPTSRALTLVDLFDVADCYTVQCFLILCWKNCLRNFTDKISVTWR